MTQTTIPIPQRETDPSLDYEHLQLSLEEAFFLVFAIEVIEVTDPSEDSEHKAAFSIQDCWLRFAQASVARSPIAKTISLPEFQLEPDNPFIVRYVVYHYYRSQGWVVKDGLKYGTDFMLYRKGMVFGHSQYGVRAIPCHDFGTLLNNQESKAHVSALSMQTIQPVMSPTPGSSMPHTVYSWQWLLSLNRIISQVQKTTLICHVVLPQSITPQQLCHPRTALPLYSVVELGIKRFLPERNRA
ncbi:tRNA splicing endonuclease subunit sen2 [Mortierella antarctica]|nr:tRNA splicing endonuclease subunit sen2 [Mortierella antarctica]